MLAKDWIRKNKPTKTQAKDFSKENFRLLETIFYELEIGVNESARLTRSQCRYVDLMLGTILGTNTATAAERNILILSLVIYINSCHE